MKLLKSLAIVGSTKATLTASEASLAEIKRYELNSLNQNPSKTI